LVNQRAEDRVGTRVDVLVEEWDGEVAVGRAAHQGPDVDGVVRLLGAAGIDRGQFVPAFVVDTDGVDLIAKPSGDSW
jgi:hypothetical protein